MTALVDLFVAVAAEGGSTIDRKHATRLIRLHSRRVSAGLGVTYAHYVRHYLDERQVEHLARSTARNLDSGATGN